MTTEERLENLERELARTKRRNRWLVAVVGLAVVGLILAWTWNKTTATVQAQAVGGAEKVIRANAFILEDENGKTRARLGLGLNNAGPVALDLFDENGKDRVELVADMYEPRIRLYDEKGKARAWLRVGKDGSPSLDLRDENGEIRAMVSLDEYGACLHLSDENGKIRAWLRVLKDGPSLLLSDENRKTIWSAP